MTTGLVLSGGGARGSFEMGAIEYLYEAYGLRPDVIVGSSVGAINGVKLAEAETREEQLAAMQELREIWMEMQSNSDMYVESPWMASISRTHLKSNLRKLGEGGNILDSIGTLINLGMGLGDIMQSITEFQADSSSVYRLDPIEDRLRGRGRPADLNRDKVRDGIADLRLAVVGLESGALRYVTEGGRLLERDLSTSAIGDRTVDLIDGVMASATMPGIFKPVTLAGETYVDGGVREIIPVEAAVEMGCDDVFAISASRLSVTPQEQSMDSANFIDILLRSLVDVTLAEIVEGDLDVESSITVIAPDFDVHDTTEIDPGLIAISKDYGYMRAGERASEAGAIDRERAETLSDAIAKLRKQTFELEEQIFPRWLHNENPHTPLRMVRLLKWLTHHTVATRAQIGGPTPTSALTCHLDWERFTGERYPPNPWDELLTPTLEVTSKASFSSFMPPETSLREEGTGRLWAVKVGARFPVPGEDTLRDIGFQPQHALSTPEGVPKALPTLPKYPSVWKELSEPKLWYFDGSKRYRVQDSTVANHLNLSRYQTNVVPDGGLDNIPDGGPVNWVGSLYPVDHTSPGSSRQIKEVVVESVREDTEEAFAVYLRNRHHSTVTISGLNITNDPDGAFEIDADLPIQLSSSDITQIKVVFSPDRLGSFSPHLVVESDAPRLPTLEVPIRAEVTQPGSPRGKLEVEPASLDFGTVTVGTPESRAIQLTNTGNANVYAEDIEITNAMPEGQFHSPWVLPQPIEPGGTKQIHLNYLPTERGQATAMASLRASVGGGQRSAHTISLQGQSIAPDISLSPSVLDFGVIQPGDNSTRSLEIENTGDGDLTVSGITVRLSGREFWLDPSITFPFTLSSGETRTVSITYTAPQTPGTRNEDIFEVLSNDPDTPQAQLQLMGRVGGPNMEYPDFIDFGEVQSVPSQSVVTITNTGSSDLLLREAQFETGDVFSVTNLQSLPITLTPGTQLTFQVQFDAGEPGRYQDQLRLQSNHRRLVGGEWRDYVTIGIEADY